jgi:membrane protease YdiL (CAAX protease family)
VTDKNRIDASKSNAWTDLALTVPIFLAYHLGVVLLRVRNAADPVTAELVRLASNDIGTYWALTAGVGLAMVVVFSLLGRGKAFEAKRFAWVMLEGTIYAVAMRLIASQVVGALTLSKGLAVDSSLSAVVMSCGAGLYEEIAFRVGLFGLGALAIRAFAGGIVRMFLVLLWALVAAAAFSAWHYTGPMADSFSWWSFVFRWVCGLVFTLIYRFRGFAPAVWTHVLYDVWVMALR